MATRETTPNAPLDGSLDVRDAGGSCCYLYRISQRLPLQHRRQQSHEHVAVRAKDVRSSRQGYDLPRGGRDDITGMRARNGGHDNRHDQRQRIDGVGVVAVVVRA